MIDQHIRILFNREIASGIFLLELESPQIASESKPGQFVMVRINQGIDPLLRRPFSICGISDKGIIRILYKTAGHGTEILADRKKGEILSVMGPLGQGFSLPVGNNKTILIGGGIGIAPLFFLAERLEDSQMEFMSGFGTSNEIIPCNRITDRTVSISVATDDGSEGYPGMVTGLLDDYLDRYSDRISDPVTIYACGPMAMLKRVSHIASLRDIQCQVSLEALMACGLGACQGCAVRILSKNAPLQYSHVCKDGPVFPSKAIDWSAI